MVKFIKRLLIFIFPIFLLGAVPIGTFYLDDPFKILNEYAEFNNSIVAYNEDYVATERYLKDPNLYDSFILGSSRAGCGFNIESWQKAINPERQAYSFTASNESLFGILGKLKLINDVGHLKNLILVIDLDKTMNKTVNSKGHLYIKHPLVSGESRKAFVTEYLKGYLFSGFFIAYLDYKFFKTKREYMDDYLSFEGKSINEIYFAFDVNGKEERIQKDSIKYYLESDAVFYDRPIKEHVLNELISSKCKTMFSEIKKLLIKNNTSYKIVISPLYDQKKINEKDLEFLRSTFEQENVFDFSGINEITQDKYNYYEQSHYRRHVGDRIIKNIYN